MKKRYDVPLGRTVWEVEVRCDVIDYAVPGPVRLQAFAGGWYIPAPLTPPQLQALITWNPFDAPYGERRHFTSKKKAQLELAKLILAGEDAKLIERRENDFSGWRR